MHHLSDGDLQAWIDGELPEGSARRRLESHLAECGECERRLEALKAAGEAFANAMLVLDDGTPAEPAPDFEEVARRAGARRRRLFGVPAGTLARAAALVLVAAGAAAAVVPGSPLRDWIADLATPDTTEAPAPVAEVEPPSLAEGYGGASVWPVEGRLRVDVNEFSPDAAIRVRLTDEPQARIRVDGDPGAARFVVGSGAIEIEGREGATGLTVDLPRSVELARVSIDGELAVAVRDRQLEVFRPVMDWLRGDVVFRVQP